MPETEKYVRDELDRFYTDPRVAAVFAREAIKLFGRRRIGLFIEPSIGGGALSKAVADEARIAAVKIDFTLAVDVVRDPALQFAEGLGEVKYVEEDWLTLASKYVGGADLIVTNPPFAKSVPATTGRAKKAGKMKQVAVIQDHVKANFAALAEGGLLGVLSRQSFHGQPRDVWLSEEARPFKIQQLSPRPSFTANGKTDSAEYVLSWWEKSEGSVHAPKTQFEWLRWK